MGRWTSWGTGLLALFLLLVLQTLGFAEERYTVKTGDSLYKIAKAYGVSIVALKAANHLETENLRPRQVLVIPASREKRTLEAVQPPVSEVAKKPSVESVSYLVKKGDIEELGRMLKEILENDERRREMGARGNNYVLSRFSLDLLAARHEEFYSKAILNVNG